MLEQGHENEQQHKAYHTGSFPEDDEILMKKAEMESYNEEEKELLMWVAKETRYDTGRIKPNLKYTDRKKVGTATMRKNKIASIIKAETITETNSVLGAAGSVATEMVGYKNQKTENRQPNWQKNSELKA